MKRRIMLHPGDSVLVGYETSFVSHIIFCDEDGSISIKHNGSTLGSAVSHGKWSDKYSDYKDVDQGARP